MLEQAIDEFLGDCGQRLAAPAAAGADATLAQAQDRANAIAPPVLPAAAPGIISGVLLAIARAAGETAPLLFTILTVNIVNTDIFRGANTALSVQIFRNAQQVFPGPQERAWGAALTLIAIVVVFTVIARIISAIFSRKHHA